METTQLLSPSLLQLSEDKQQLLLLIRPVQEEVTVDRLIEIFQQSDYASLKLDLNGIKEAVQQFHRLANKLGTKPKSIVIGERLDAQLNIEFDPLKIAAKAKIISAYGGSAITIEQIQHKMDELNICYGVNNNALPLLIDKSQQAAPGALYQITVAKGKKPVHGCDANFKRLVETPSERLLKPQQKADGRVDMHNLGELITVKPGDPLMRKIPHVEGNSGTSVTGEEIEYRAGKDLPLEAGKNTALCATDPNLLVATLSGIPKVINNGMQVDDVLLVENVDVSYGNINYDGSLIVEGDICAGMEVIATGDINVAGFIDSAKIACGGDLRVGKGIIGHQSESNNTRFSCDVNCKGSVTANFSQYSKIHAGLDVTIETQLLHCHTICDGEIKVKNRAGNKGTILGGILRCNQGISTVTLGAGAGSKTIIELVGLYSKLIAAKKQINVSLQQEQEKLQHLLVAQKKIDALAELEKKQILEARLMLTREAVKEKIFSLKKEQEKNFVDLQRYFENAKVIAEKELYSGISVSIGRETFRSLRNYGPTKVSVQNGKLSVEPYLK